MFSGDGTGLAMRKVWTIKGEMSSVKSRWVIASVLVIAAAVGGIYAWYEMRPAGIPAGFVASNGRIEATEIDVATKYAGRIEQVLVREGDTVDAEQVVARMDTSELLAQLHQAQAQEHEEDDLRKTDQRLAELAETEFGFTARDYQRYSELAGENVVSRQSLDQYTTKMGVARSAYAAAQAKVAADVGAIGQARADIERFQIQLNDRDLKAPVRARVLYKLAEPGEVLAAGGNVVTVIDLTDVYMTIFLPELEAGKVAIGADARVILDAAPQWPLAAQVSYVAAKAQFTPKSVETTIERQKLTFRVKVQLNKELLRKYEPWVKVGLPGVAYIKVDPNAEWPAQLEAREPTELLKIMPHQGIPKNTPRGLRP